MSGTWLLPSGANIPHNLKLQVHGFYCHLSVRPPHELFTAPVLQALQLYLDARLGWAQTSLAAAGKGSLSASSISQELTSFGNAVQVTVPAVLRPCSRCWPHSCHQMIIFTAPGWLMSRQQTLAVVCSIVCLRTLSSGCPAPVLHAHCAWQMLPGPVLHVLCAVLCNTMFLSTLSRTTGFSLCSMVFNSWVMCRYCSLPE